jgi:hypothetical protein
MLPKGIRAKAWSPKAIVASTSLHLSTPRIKASEGPLHDGDAIFNLEREREREREKKKKKNPYPNYPWYEDRNPDQFHH